MEYLIGTPYLNAQLEEQIEILKTYVSVKMQKFGLGNWVFFVGIGLFISLWISGVLTIPLRKLVAAIERVAQGDLERELLSEPTAGSSAS